MATTDDWSSGSSAWSGSGAGTDASYWTPERMAQAQPMGMWGAPQGGMTSPYSGGYGMQSPYGGYQSPYGGFGGGMPYGGGYGMQTPYGAPGGGYGMASASPYAMSGYSMGGSFQPSAESAGGATSAAQGGANAQDIANYWTPQMMAAAQGMGMAQAQPMGAQNMMAQAGMAPQTASGTGTTALQSQQQQPATGTQAQTLAASGSPGDIAKYLFDVSGNLSGTQTQTFKPWEPLGQEYLKLFPEAQHEFFRQFGHTDAQGVFHPGQGPLGFDPSSSAALARMEQLAQGGNPMLNEAMGATRDISSGRAGITNAGQYGQLYNNGFTGEGQYQQMANRGPISGIGQYDALAQNGGITGIPQYQGMANRDAITNADQYNRLQADISAAPFTQIGNQAQGPGSLEGGMFGQTARGEMVGANPHREAAIQNAMDEASKQTKATMSGRGRYGSDAYGDAMGKALGQVATQARMAGYDTDTANMMAAAQARSGEGLARQGIGLQAAQGVLGTEQAERQSQLAAAQGLSGMQGANAQQRLAALQGMTGAQGQAAQNRLAAMAGRGSAQLQNQQAQLAALQGLTGMQQARGQQQLAAAQGLTGLQNQNLQNRLAAAGMAPQMQGLRYDDASRLAQAGAAREAMAQQQRNFGWEQMGQYRNILGNLPGSAGSQQSSSQPSWLQSALGLAGIFGGIGGMGG